MMRKKLFFLAVASAGFVGMIPLVVVGGHEIGGILDSTTFCTSCHDVHYSEEVTYQASPHSEVTCARCHVGPSTGNLVRSKLRGLTDIIPALTRNYERPIPTPLKDRRPSSETCEKCHYSEKFFGDVPQIAVSYNADELNTRNVVTRVLKVGGGRQEVASGIHWHSTAKVWYLPLDEKRLTIGWVGSEDASGNITAYVDPNRSSEITPERVNKEKRLMDCMDCHNRVTHLYRSPDSLVDDALSDGSIDVKLPFIKHEAVAALVPQNASLEQAYAKVDRIKDFYQASYPSISQDKAVSIVRAVEKLREIARLTTFPDGLDWNTYPDHAIHDKPNSEMEVDWEGISRRDESPGCFRCHGNLVKVDNKNGTSQNASAGGPNSGGAMRFVSLKGDSGSTASLSDVKPGGDNLKRGGPPAGRIDGECDTCHYSPKSDVISPVAPAVPHPVDGLDDCLVCHKPSGPEPFKADHPWTTNGACSGCHQSAPKLKSLPLSAPREIKQITHATNKLEECLTCHGPAAAEPLSREHPWTTNKTCTACHESASTLKPLPPAAPSKPEDITEITHSVDKLGDCLTCHGPASPKPFKKEHPWATDETCRSCHQLAAKLKPLPPSTPLKPEDITEITHSVDKLGD
ncbi:MAG: NapC/NirT family cytochrome c [Chloroflexi bacterium]|nr:NapC/NirT family cytochrome c [Chloroflexota bacterium]